MKTGLRLNCKLRMLYAYINLLRFTILNKLLGFDVANQFLQRVDKHSIQLILKRYGAIIGKNCDIETGLTFHNCQDYSNLIIGDNCHIGKNCFFDLREKVIIGNNVVISMLCTFITHIDLNKTPLSKRYPAQKAEIKIQDNVYLGANVTILKKVHIGKNAIVGAKSLVKYNVDHGIVVAGIPANPIR